MACFVRSIIFASYFWVSRVEKGSDGQYHINNVIGSNEWQENIDDNSFTNGMVKTVLPMATKAAQELGITPNPQWNAVAANVPILTFPDGTTKENRTYDGVMIKQADVNLLAFPLKLITDETRVRKDLAITRPAIHPMGPPWAGRCYQRFTRARATPRKGSSGL